MRVIMPPIAHRGITSEKVVGTPGDDVRLCDGNVLTARGAPIRLLRTMRWNISHVPFATPAAL